MIQFINLPCVARYCSYEDLFLARHTSHITHRWSMPKKKHHWTQMNIKLHVGADHRGQSVLGWHSWKVHEQNKNSKLWNSFPIIGENSNSISTCSSTLWLCVCVCVCIYVLCFFSSQPDMTFTACLRERVHVGSSLWQPRWKKIVGAAGAERTEPWRYECMGRCSLSSSVIYCNDPSDCVLMHSPMLNRA